MTACPPCDEGRQHEYDDDKYLAAGVPGSRVGDPCVWCDHEKCVACPAVTAERYRVVCAGRPAPMLAVLTHDTAADARERAASLDELVGCGPHRVERLTPEGAWVRAEDGTT